MIPVPEREPLEIELLVSAHQRRLSVEEHHRWSERLAAETPRTFDEIDEDAATVPTAGTQNPEKIHP